MGKVALVVIIVLAAATFYWTSNSYQGAANNQQPRTWIDESGQLHVLGLTIGKSTVRDAELALRSRSDAAIFMYPIPTTGQEQQFKLALEAYFPSIADHSKVLLKLDIDDAKLEEIRQRSTSPRIYPNGVARINLSNDDILAVKALRIDQITLIPSTQLSQAILRAQFGQESAQLELVGGVTRYMYPSIGLAADILEEGKDKLVFQNPKQSIK